MRENREEDTQRRLNGIDVIRELFKGYSSSEIADWMWSWIFSNSVSRSRVVSSTVSTDDSALPGRELLTVSFDLLHYVPDRIQRQYLDRVALSTRRIASRMTQDQRVAVLS